MILVDDGSPDNCGKICDEYAEKYSRVHVIHKENGGLSDARNAGIDWAFANSDSEWITFIDSDDWIYPKYLEVLYNAVQQTGCFLSVCGYKKTEGDEPYVDEKQLASVFYKSEDFYCEKNVNAVIAVCKLYKKSDFKDIRYPVGKLHEDEFTTYKILFKYGNVAFVDQPLYFYYQNENSITKSNWTPERMSSIDALKYQMEYFKKNNFTIAFHKSIEGLIGTIQRQIYDLKGFHDSKLSNRYSNYLKRELRKIIRLGEKEKMFSVKKDDVVYLYELAFPIKMKLYWYLQAIKRKIGKK